MSSVLIIALMFLHVLFQYTKGVSMFAYSDASEYVYIGLHKHKAARNVAKQLSKLLSKNK